MKKQRKALPKKELVMLARPSDLESMTDDELEEKICAPIRKRMEEIAAQKEADSKPS